MPAMPTAKERTRDRPILETARIRLRRPEAGDIASIVAIAGDWDVARRLSRVPHPYGETDAHFFLETIVPAEWTWAITFRASGELIGMSGLTPQPAHEIAELGYYVARPHWGSASRRRPRGRWSNTVFAWPAWRVSHPAISWTIPRRAACCASLVSLKSDAPSGTAWPPVRPRHPLKCCSMPFRSVPTPATG